ncbi:orotidine-5'-phosphate decarboxylase [bacterium]|nr:orotidine-5'-phosphate decarboxylase [bacterium]
MRLNKPISAKERIILALDTDDLEEVRSLVNELKDYVGYFKVGLQLLTLYGLEAVKVVRECGGKVYYDSKFHDIPNTVAHSCANLVKNDVEFFNIHLQGGSKMVAQAVKASKDTAKAMNIEPPAIFGVTLLSSFGQRTLTQELCVEEDIEEYAMQLAHIAHDCGLNGIVAGASEAKKIRDEFGDDFIILCPATRPTWAAVNDQVRVDTPTEAVLSGIDYLVIGRPITEAEDKISACNLIIDEINTALNK